MKRIVSIVIILLILGTGLCSAESMTYRLLDEGDEIKAIQRSLITIGYLDADCENGLFDRFTKTAVEALQKDYNLPVTGEVTPEISLIISLLNRIQARETIPTSTPRITPKPTQVPIPSVTGMKESTAITTLEKQGFVVDLDYVFSDDISKGNVISAKRDRSSNSVVNVVISKGPKIISFDQATWYAWWLKGSEKDDYDINDLYIDYEKQTLFIILDATFGTSYHYKWRGYGNASITDTFDKTVPVWVKYTNEFIEKGKTQRVTLEIPINDLNVERPTTMSVSLAMYYGASYNKEDYLRIDFTMAW